jgi:hypothetical protein
MSRNYTESQMEDLDGIAEMLAKFFKTYKSPLLQNAEPVVTSEEAYVLIPGVPSVDKESLMKDWGMDAELAASTVYANRQKRKELSDSLKGFMSELRVTACPVFLHTEFGHENLRIIIRMNPEDPIGAEKTLAKLMERVHKYQQNYENVSN